MATVVRLDSLNEAEKPGRDALYRECAAELGAAVERLARGYEADEARRKDLVQEIHVALWRSFATFDGRCSLRTWTYRVAHNVAATHVLRGRRRGKLVALDDLEDVPSDVATDDIAHRARTVERLTALVLALEPRDRQVMLLYLEGEDASAIADVTGLSTSNVATKIHRIKKALAQRFEGERS